jgi:hypothetical protein
MEVNRSAVTSSSLSSRYFILFVCLWLWFPSFFLSLSLSSGQVNRLETAHDLFFFPVPMFKWAHHNKCVIKSNGNQWEKNLELTWRLRRLTRSRRSRTDHLNGIEKRSGQQHSFFKNNHFGLSVIKSRMRWELFEWWQIPLEPTR